MDSSSLLAFVGGVLCGLLILAALNFTKKARRRKTAAPAEKPAKPPLNFVAGAPFYKPIVEEDSFRGDLINGLLFHMVHREPRPKDD